jgi:hypothetical protein
MQLGIRRAEKAKVGHGWKERPEFNGCPHKTTLKMEATCSSETSVYFQWATQCYLPEDRTLHNYKAFCFRI